MRPTIRVTPQTYCRLEKHARGFDTPSKVIERLLECFEKDLPNDNSLASPLGYIDSTLEDKGRRLPNKEIQKRVAMAAQVLTDEELEEFCDLQHSKDVFGINFPLFVRLPSASNKAEKKKAVRTPDDVPRWTWRFEFERSGHLYAITTQWYEWNESAVEQWLKAHE
ncbi:MAG: hypothetical protein Q7V56_12200 [Gammaproteobacteria bacterium]|nr:hypothetical protein [Gammaproteobacteria bacterium]